MKKFFISGTDTNVGKTIISSWICCHTNYSYFKPIQTGNTLITDSKEVNRLGNGKIFQENYSFREPVSPHLAALSENSNIELENIILPNENNVIVEGAGGLLVPINKNYLMIDIIQKFAIPTLLVARTSLGTINHTLLSLEALRARNIKIAGVILNGKPNLNNLQAIEHYGKVKVLATFPELENVTRNALSNVLLPSRLNAILM